MILHTRKFLGLRLQEGGLVGVIVVLGMMLAGFGGRVKMPEVRKDSTGQPERVMVEKNKFFNSRTLIQLAKDTSFVAIMAVGATFVIVAGGIDLSVGATYSLASILGAMFLRAYGPDGMHALHLAQADGTEKILAPWFAVPMGIAICLGVGIACGLINGLMIVALQVHPFIITLGTMAIFRGIAFVVTNGQSIGGFPQAFRDLIRWETAGGLGLTPLIVMILVTVLAGIYLSKFAAGRRIFALGGNETASRFSGVRVKRVKLGVYLVSGLTAGVAATLALGYYGSASSSDGQGYELNVIAAAVVGGASLVGGKGSAIGALLGALILQMINTGIVILGINQNYSQIIMGAVVIIAVVLDQLNHWMAQRGFLRRERQSAG